jgi:sugar-specific transcriptional regulator TrmB
MGLRFARVIDIEVETLTKLGLTASQAKIYLGTIALGQSTAKAIAKKAQMDRSETYTVISTLEKRGIVQRIITNPTAKFTAVPVAQLVSALVERKKIEFSELEKGAKQLSQHYKNQSFEGEQEEFLIRVPDTELNIGKIKESHLKFKKTCHTVTTNNIISSGFPLFKKELWKAVQNGLEIVLIQEKSTIRSPVSKEKRNLMHHPSLSIRFSKQTDVVPVAIFDDKEVWINLVHGEKKGFFEGKYLFSNNPNLVALAKKYFDQMYASSAPAEITVS